MPKGLGVISSRLLRADTIYHHSFTLCQTIQRRLDGSENFFRGWDDYVTGFGSKDSEYWLGKYFKLRNAIFVLAIFHFNTTHYKIDHANINTFSEFQHEHHLISRST